MLLMLCGEVPRLDGLCGCVVFTYPHCYSCSAAHVMRLLNIGENPVGQCDCYESLLLL